MIEFVDYNAMMKLRRDYNLGTRTDETRAAALQYINLRRKGQLKEFKERSR
ncbi:hypothetical protein [Acinetobacter baumannii]|uniref:hypothetical protein n=1 Tax=Acinetobacter baumannii TaxID=470 RepID=UPI000AF4D8BC|nr:hypothetical protein [Acinetobacter baumannii]